MYSCIANLSFPAVISSNSILGGSPDSSPSKLSSQKSLEISHVLDSTSSLKERMAKYQAALTKQTKPVSPTVCLNFLKLGALKGVIVGQCVNWAPFTWGRLS